VNVYFIIRGRKIFADGTQIPDINPFYQGHNPFRWRGRDYILLSPYFTGDVWQVYEVVKKPTMYEEVP
jgi:hypothetical protein